MAVPDARSSRDPYRTLVTLGTIILVVASLYWAQKVLIPIALAILIAFVLRPAVDALQRRRIPRVIAVLLVVVLAFAILGGIGASITLQLQSLANDLPQNKDRIAAKINGVLGARRGGFFDRFSSTVQDIANQVLAYQQPEQKPAQEPVTVRLERPSAYSEYFAQFRDALEPAAEALATTVLVVVLVIFTLVKQEDLRNRLVQLIGGSRLVLTTRALDEAAERISSYLVMQVLINAGVGTVLCLGLALIHVPYALLWGVLTALLRFVPYIGVWVAAALMLAFSVAVSPGWTEPLLALALILTIELITANILEPLLFGHSTGISTVALLVAAAFWTWLWGPIGLVLSTPLTACLVVLGKYVPQLAFFSTLLGDEPSLDPDLTYYQRLLARDQDEATELIETYLHSNPLPTVYDEILIPALTRAKADRERGELDAEGERFVLQATSDVLEDLLLPQVQVQVIATKGVPPAESERTDVVVIGCPARDAEDEVALHMFEQMLEPTKCRLEVLSTQTLSGELILSVEKERPALVCIASLPPGGLTLTRHLCKRLRLRFPDLRIAVGVWGLRQNIDQARERLQAAGANFVATKLLESRDQIVPLVQAAAHTTGGPAGQELETAKS